MKEIPFKDGGYFFNLLQSIIIFISTALTPSHINKLLSTFAAQK